MLKVKFGARFNALHGTTFHENMRAEERLSLSLFVHGLSWWSWRHFSWAHAYAITNPPAILVCVVLALPVFFTWKGIDSLFCVCHCYPFTVKKWHGYEIKSLLSEIPRVSIAVPVKKVRTLSKVLGLVPPWLQFACTRLPDRRHYSRCLAFIASHTWDLISFLDTRRYSHNFDFCWYVQLPPSPSTWKLR